MLCVRPGVLLDAASVPSVRNTDRHGNSVPLNCYILDYWGHGQKQLLTSANGMREGVVTHSLLYLCFSHDRPIVQGYPDGCQHRL